NEVTLIMIPEGQHVLRTDNMLQGKTRCGTGRFAGCAALQDLSTCSSAYWLCAVRKCDVRQQEENEGKVPDYTRRGIFYGTAPKSCSMCASSMGRKRAL